MSLHARRSRAPFERWLSCLLALAPALAGAQTIADYSRAQRALLESAMSQAAARSAAIGASAPAMPAAAASAAPAAAPRVAMPVLPPAVQVSGVFASHGQAVAEIVVNATAYMLDVGQGVPGTPWHVETIAIDKVVLGRPGGLHPGEGEGEGTRKVFALPALR